MKNMSYVKGRNSVLEALKSERAIKEIIIAKGNKSGHGINEILSLAKDRNIPCRFYDNDWLSSRAGKYHQGVIAAVEEYDYLTLEEFLENLKGDELILILDSIQDPRNLGAIIRTAECAGAAGIIIPEHRSAQITPVVEKSSAGALSYMPMVQVVNLNTAMTKLKERGFWIAGLSLAGEKNYIDTDLRGPLCLVLGSEGKGMRPLIEKNCDFTVKIPLMGKISSLNVSVACGVVLYEILRQRSKS